MTKRDDRLRALVAKDEITDAIHRVARGTDRLDRDLILSGYHPDGFDDHNSFRGDPVAFADWVVAVLPYFYATHHVLGQCRIELDGKVAHVETYCTAHHVGYMDPEGRCTDMVIGLRYIDRFERRKKQWRIAHRVCAFDWTVTVRADELWPFGDDFTVGRRDRTDPTYRSSDDPDDDDLDDLDLDDLDDLDLDDLDLDDLDD
jgi:hypothetical protein